MYDPTPTHPPPFQPRLRRLASKPLKLAASTFKTRTRSSASTSSLTDTPTSKPQRKRHQHLHHGGAGLSPVQVAAAARGPQKPLQGEEPAARVRVRVVRADKLVAKDRGGTSDPFVNLVLPPAFRHSTPVVKRSLNPNFPAETSTFEFPLYMSLAGVVGGRGLECVVWDKDLMRKEYMGEVTIPLSDWFPKGEVAMWSNDLPLLTRPLLSTRRKRDVTGTISVQIGFVPTQSISPEGSLNNVQKVFKTFLAQSNAGRDHEGIGTVRVRAKPSQSIAVAPETIPSSVAKGLLSTAAAVFTAPMSGSHRMVPVPTAGGESDLDDDEIYEDALADDGLSSSSSDDDFDDALENEIAAMRLQESPGDVETVVEHTYDEVGLPPPPKGPSTIETRASKTSDLLQPKIPTRTTMKRQPSLPGYFDRRHGQHDEETPGVSSPGGGTPGVLTPGGHKRRLFKRNKTKDTLKSESKKNFNFNASDGREVLGIVFVEIKSAMDLPKIKNTLKFGFDMDPFVVISFGKKVFRTRVIRHNLNPSWDERLLFHVRRHETAYTLNLSVLDWDKLSGNDMVGTCSLPLSELVADAPKPNPETGLYGKNEDGKHEMREFRLPITTNREVSWESKHSPTLSLRAKYEPYDALRQRFWRQYITQYDSDETGTMSYTELTAMLDSLGSTLTQNTIEGYFESCDKNADTDELTLEEVIQCLEREATKPRHEKAKVVPDDKYSVAPQPIHDGLAMTGPQGNISSPVDPKELAEHIRLSQPRQSGEERNRESGNMRPIAEGTEHDLAVPALKVDPADALDSTPPSRDDLITPGSGFDAEPDATPSPASELEVDPQDERERIINIRTCPLCHRPRLSRKTETDIVTHLAICASSDWSRVDRIVTANYVTSSQAQRKFWTRMVNKVAIGAYSLGANSANILVQDRRTGQLQEEKMAVYVRLGIRVLYKGAKGRMEGARARKLLKSLSVKQGLKYDSPQSAIDIPAFIAFHNLPVEEIRDPIESFTTFNQFFYRKLKAEARPVENPGDEGRLVSCADCRMMAFESVGEATRLWIKGREFSVGRLLGSEYKGIWDKFEGGALGIWRLAPQDYHRFHSPVKGKIGKMTLIDGEHYTVNPQAIRTTLDVYGENVRKVVPVESEEFGTVMTVWIGAMMVGSILTTVEEGQLVKRADELGYFAFGGSTIVCLFEKGALEWDEDLLQNGRATIETLVRMGTGLGRSTRVSSSSTPSKA